MNNLLIVLQIISGFTLIVLVLLQVRGTGFARSVSTHSFTRRGLERVVFRSSFIISAFFLIVSILSLALR